MKFYVTLTIAVLGIGLVAGTASAQDQIDYTEMVEDLKVMCRIINETMDETFENDYVKGGFFRRGGCQHLYLKGYGPVFLLDVRFPVAEKEMKIVKTEKETNLWEKHEREVRHQGQPEEAAWIAGKNESYSKEKVDKLKEQLAYLVGEYGSRIGQLTLDDTISFVVFGYPDYAVDLETDIMGFVRTVTVDYGDADAMSHTREALSHAREALSHVREMLSHPGENLEEKKEKLQVVLEKIEELKEKIAEQASQDDDKEEEKDEEMKDLEPEKVKRFRIPIPPTPPTPPTPPSFPHRFRGKPATTLILTFKRSQLEGKNGTDWEALLKAAEVVEY